ncbi:MAG TPA: hypothetical protein PL066_01500 [bacterium]|nr:hypothetical protein [bacterium]
MDNLQDGQANGQLLYRWQTVNRIPTYRGKLWYVVFAIFVGLFLFYAFWSDNFLLAIIILLIVFLVMLMNYQPVSELKILMFPDYLLLEGEAHRYKALKDFWISEDITGLSKLYWQYRDDKFGKKQYSLMLLGEVNPLKIRQILLDGGVSENANPPERDFWDILSRLLRL